MPPTSSLQETDSGPDCNSREEHGLTGERHPRSRGISQAKVQKQELVVRRNWKTDLLG